MVTLAWEQFLFWFAATHPSSVEKLEIALSHLDNSFKEISPESYSEAVDHNDFMAVLGYFQSYMEDMHSHGKPW